MVELLFWPFLTVLVISGVHVYLGLHIVARGVIFVDLALAQVAAVGSTVGFLLGLEGEGLVSYLVALAFTLLGAWFFTVARDRRNIIPQEAIIGITYVVAAAVMILLLSKAPEGAEHINALLVGSILFVTPKIVGTMFGLIMIAGLLLYLFRQRFIAATEEYHLATAGRRDRLWNFLFYAIFGLVVTGAVRIVGVLLIFTYLIIPAAAVMLFYRGWGARLLAGWVFSVLVSLLGMLASVWLDMPTGAAIVAAAGAGLVVLTVLRLVMQRTGQGGQVPVDMAARTG